MKKLFVLFFMLAILLTACSHENKFPQLQEVNDCAPEELQQHMESISRQELMDIWGQPSLQLSDGKTDLWDINESQFIVICWDDNGQCDFMTKQAKTSASDIWDSIAFDVDNDGVEETCVLGCGETSGIFSFYLVISENGKTEYYNTFAPATHSELSFEEQDGKLKVKYVGEIPQLSVKYETVTVENGNLYLRTEGQAATRAYLYKATSDQAALSLMADGTFGLSISRLSSYYPCGTYEQTQAAVVLKTDDGENTYIFRKDGENLIFDGEKSSPMPKFSYSAGAEATVCIPDSAVFEPYQMDFNQDSIAFDVDNDGIDELCTLGMGPTSGLFTFTLTITENGVLEYFNIFLSEFYELSFAEQDGVLKLKGVTQGENPETHAYDILLKDGNVVLERNGEALGYWGEQGINSRFA